MITYKAFTILHYQLETTFFKTPYKLKGFLLHGKVICTRTHFNGCVTSCFRTLF
jgi:hypothetical protein